MPAKRNRWLRSISSQWKQPLARPAGQQYAKSVSHICQHLHSLALFPPRVLPSQSGSAAFRNRIFCCDTFPQSSLNGGEYHTQIDLAANHFFPPRCIKDVCSNLSARKVERTDEPSHHT